MALVTDVLERMRAADIGHIPVVVGGIIPPEDAKTLLAAGAAAIYTPKDYQLADIMGEIADLVDREFNQAA